MLNRNSVTMKKVAEQAGVSMMTVSLALRNEASGSRVAEETRQRVLEAARTLGYRPNARGRALRSGVTNVIGLYAGYGFVNVRMPFFTEIVSGLQEGCEQFKKDLLLHGTFHGDTPEDILTELSDGRIDGLIVNMPSGNPLADHLAESHLPVVAVADALPNIPSIVVDDAGGSRQIVAFLLQRGYRRVLYLSSVLEALSAIRRCDAFKEAAAAAGLETEEVPSSDRLGWENGFLARYITPGQPLAVVCWNDQTAYGVLAHCRRHNIRVPEEVAIIGFDGCPTPLEEVWSLTTVRAPWAEVARTAVEYLNALMEGKPVPPETVLPVEFLAGQTA